MRAAERRERDREQARRTADLADVIRDTLPEISPEAATETSRRIAEQAEAARPDGISALLCELEAIGVRP